ncbi:hypothetical protein LZK98_08210 [Sphingomonas cannabina]|uniref:hypothetical protein n=1 Tax=Sphingomonas cannabina TaxID=2899123 RepID=UPI001F460467|nr:hypothetical protein [Sphingomonas cannabina]UIJ46912.1 hypothetical protein LZK98_08210 [Sphingomonas cannabina]
MASAFGAWLTGQATRDDWVGELAAKAARDPGFPVDGDPHRVRVHLSGFLASFEVDGDVFEALEDAEREWLAS